MWPGVEKNKPAPGYGDLFTVHYALWLNQRVDSCPAEIEAAVTATASAFKEDLKYQAVVMNADRHVVEVERDAYKRKVEEAPNMWLVVGITAGLTALVVTALYVGTGAGDRLRDEVAGIR